MKLPSLLLYTTLQALLLAPTHLLVDASTSSAVLRHATTTTAAGAHSTSSAVLRHATTTTTARAVCSSSALATGTSRSLIRKTGWQRGIRRSQLLHQQRSTTTRQYAAAYSPSFVGRSAVARSGFRQFSQRATRLQFQLKKSFSLRAVVGDVVTNNPDATPGETSSTPPPLKVHRAQPFVSTITTITAGTAAESLGGFIGGYILGATTHLTRKCYCSVKRSIFPKQPRALPTILKTSGGAATSMLPYPCLTKLSQQSLRFHAHNMGWAAEWAKISAVFGACRLLVKTARRHGDSDADEDGWDTVGGSSLAGAILAMAPTRRVVPTAMTRSALMYGSTMFLLHPDLWKQGMEALWLTLPPAPQQSSATATTSSSSSTSENQPPKVVPWYDQIDMMI